MRCAHVFGKLALEFRHARALADPATSEHFNHSLLFELPKGGPGNRNIHQPGWIHHATTATGCLTLCLHRINSCRPSSSKTRASKPNSRFAFSTAARRV